MNWIPIECVRPKTDHDMSLQYAVKIRKFHNLQIEMSYTEPLGGETRFGIN